MCIRDSVYTHRIVGFDRVCAPQSDAPSVSVSTEVDSVGSGWTGNLHPTPTIELMQGIRGDAGCMAKATIVHV